MKEADQNKAIAEWCGWHDFHKDGLATAPNGQWMPTPKYTQDLNAMHQAELRLIAGDQWWAYYQHFVDAGGVKINATAAKRAEALLKTIDKWVEEDKSAPLFSNVT